MLFETDIQTILDLNIFSQAKGELSVFEVYNKTMTKGGRSELAEMFRYALNDKKEIQKRIENTCFIQDNKLNVNLDEDNIDFIEYYFNLNTSILHDNILDSTFTWISNKIKPSNEYYIISRGLEYLKKHLAILIKFTEDIDELNKPEFYIELSRIVREIKKSPDFSSFFVKKSLTARQINHFDVFVRKHYKKKFNYFLKLTYLLDCYQTLAKVSKENNYSFPKINDGSIPYLKLSEFFHPLIKNPVTNDFELGYKKNLNFVTGANMSGKSTFLKAIGLCVYLAHLGFPVPANYMETNVYKGIYTTINISDNINKGYSHFYSEVKRIKEIALNIKEKKNVFVVFDELFRGTNVKDAFDATLLVCEGFSKIKNSLFFISTHIIEVGQELLENPKVDFLCFNSKLKGNQPIYNYKLSKSISKDKLGLVILKSENIISILDEIGDL